MSYKYILCVENSTGRLAGRLGHNRTKAPQFVFGDSESQAGVVGQVADVIFTFSGGRKKTIPKSAFYGTNWRYFGSDPDMILHTDLKSLTSERSTKKKSGPKKKLWTLAELLEEDD